MQQLRLKLAIAACGTILGGLQVLLIRRALALAGGDEVVFALTLALWLLTNALGSALGASIARAFQRVEWIFGSALLLLSFWCGGALFVLNYACQEIGWVPGMVAGGSGFIIALTIAFLPLGILGGSLFPLGCQMLKRQGSNRIATVYWYEAAGSFFSATALALIFAPHLNPILAASILAIFGFIAALCWFFPKLPLWLVLVLIPPIIYLTYPRFHDIYLQQIASLRPGVKVLDYRETPYGLIEIADLHGQVTIYENGLPLATSADPAIIEERVDLTLAQHPEPHKILWIGGSLGEGLSEALKHPSIEQIDVIEINPALWKPEITQRLHGDAQALADERVNPIIGDARNYLAQARPLRYDIILLNLPGPRTARLAKYYTVEATRLYRQALNSGGVLVFSIPSAEDYIGEDLVDLLISLKLTLERSFPQVVVLPGENAIFIAGAERAQLAVTAPDISARLGLRQIAPLYWDQYRLSDRLSASRISQLINVLSRKPKLGINQDRAPISFYLQQVLWSQQIRGGFGQILKWSRDLILPGSIITLIILSVLVIYLRFRQREKLTLYGSACATFTVGWSGIALEILALTAYQVKFGSGYREIGLLIGCFMAGLALGAALSPRLKPNLKGAFLSVQMLWVALPLGLIALLGIDADWWGSQIWLGRALFSLYLLSVGICGGIHFPLAVAYSGAESSPRAGRYYALDLMGAALGALLLGLLVLPLLGMSTCAWGIALLNLIPLVLLIKQQR